MLKITKRMAGFRASVASFALLAASGVLLTAGSAASAQMGGGADGQAPGMAFGAGRMVRGTVTATAPDHVTVKTEDGQVYDIVITPNTQVRKGRDPMKIADVHAGDGIGAMGEIDPAKKTVHALFLTVIDAEQVRKAREALGKTVIAGTVTAIDELKLTIKRTDDVVQVIQVDEDTAFRKGGRNLQAAFAADGAISGTAPAAGGRRGGTAPAPGATPDAADALTLADVKVGSVVAGQGALKNGIFVPTQLVVSDPAAQRQRRPRGDAAGTPPNPAPTNPVPSNPAPPEPN